MIKVYKITLLLIIFTFLSTYSPNNTDLDIKKNSSFFKVKKIKIINNLLVNKNDVKEKLSNLQENSIFLIKRKDIEKSLKKIDFLEKIEVKKKYPSTIIVKIFETRPVGFFFKDKVKYLIDSSSNLIIYEENLNFSYLPSIFGKNAENYFISFIKILETNKFPKDKIKNFYYYQIGRWDLELKNNKIIKFPHNLTNGIIKKSIKLLNRKDFQNYNIIDLRVDGKIIVE